MARYFVDDDRRTIWRVDYGSPRWAMRWTAADGWHPDPSQANWLVRLKAIGSPDYIDPISEADALAITGPYA